MKKILFLTSAFVPDADANGICVYNLAKEYIKRGDSVYCIAVKADDVTEYEEIEGIRIYRVKNAWFSRFLKKYGNRQGYAKWLCRIVHFLRNVCLIPIYPNTSPIRSRQVLSLAERIVEKENIDIVIGAYRPYESVYAARKLKERYGEKLKCVTVYLDLLLQRRNHSYGQKLYEYKTGRSLKKDLNSLDLVMFPVSERKSIEKQHGCKNIRFFDFPLYVKETGDKEFDPQFDKDAINLVYVGSLDENNRNPSRIFELLSDVRSRGVNLRFHIWGNVAGVERLIEKNKDFVDYHGYIDYTYVYSLLCRADYLVSVGNKVVFDMVPSKIFQLFSTGRPVINFVTNENDVSLPYFERYDFGCNLKIYDSDADNGGILYDTLTANWDGQRRNADILFLENTPSRFADTVSTALD